MKQSVKVMFQTFHSWILDITKRLQDISCLLKVVSYNKKSCFPDKKIFLKPPLLSFPGIRCATGGKTDRGIQFMFSVKVIQQKISKRKG